MRFGFTRPAVFALALLASPPAGAWLLYTDRADPAQWVVEVERAYGDIVPLASLPPEFRRLGGRSAGRPLAFRWSYGRDAAASATLTVDAAGSGVFQVVFTAREAAEGERFGAAAVLLGEGGAPLHSFYALADGVAGDFADPQRRHVVRLVLRREAAWWRQARAVAFLNMRYHPQQELDAGEVGLAMRRAVHRLTGGRGTEQRG